LVFNLSEDKNLVSKNLKLILNSPSYQLAQEDLDFLQSDEMRGVRMLLEITKPKSIFESENILSTIIVFGGANIAEKSHIKSILEEEEIKEKSSPKPNHSHRNIQKLNSLIKFSKYYDSAREFAQIVSRNSQKDKCNSHVIVTGGGPGIMEAANRGAFDVNCKSIGLNISLPHEQQPNSYITPGLCFKFNYFALRKFHFVMNSVAAVFFPGGFGTLDELFELLTLRQTGMKKNIPIILFGKEFWDSVINFRNLADSGLISDSHLNLFKFANTASEAWDLINQNIEKNKSYNSN